MCEPLSAKTTLRPRRDRGTQSNVALPFHAVLFDLRDVSSSGQGEWQHASGSADQVVGLRASGAGQVVAEAKYSGAAGLVASPLGGSPSPHSANDSPWT
jgi:hypothetical protein